MSARHPDPEKPRRCTSEAPPLPEKSSTPETVHRADLDLVVRASSGDRRAKHALALRLVDRTARIVRSLIRNPAESRDIIQDCLVEVLNNAHTYKGYAPLEGWADRIIVRRALHWAKTSRARNARVDPIVDAQLLEDPIQVREVLTERLPRPVEDYLAKVPDKLRSALLLRHWQGYSVAEIAELTRVSPRRVEKRLVRALKMIRKQIRIDHRPGKKEVT